MTASRLVALGLLLVALAVLLVNLSLVVDVWRLRPVPAGAALEGPFSFIHSSALPQMTEDLGRWPASIGITLLLLPVWLTAAGSAAAVWRIFVVRQTAEQQERFEMARKRLAWSWDFIRYHGSQLLAAQGRDRQDLALEALRRDLLGHLHVLEPDSRERLVRFLRLLGIADEAVAGLEGAGETPSRPTPLLDRAVRPAIALLAVTSASSMAWGVVSVVVILQGAAAPFHRAMGVFFGPHETSMGMVGCSGFALLLACAASGLRVMSRRLHAREQERARVVSEDRERLVEAMEAQVSRWLERHRDEPPGEQPHRLRLPDLVRAVVLLLLPELTPDQKGRLVLHLAEQGVLDGRIDLAGAPLRGAELSGADLTGVSLAGCDLADGRLSGACLAGADLAGIRLEGADLSRADLSGADLYRAVLWSARLQGADLRDARLVEAALDEANLWNANLTGADLTGARITDRQLEVAKPAGDRRP